MCFPKISPSFIHFEIRNKGRNRIITWLSHSGLRPDSFLPVEIFLQGDKLLRRLHLFPCDQVKFHNVADWQWNHFCNQDSSLWTSKAILWAKREAWWWEWGGSKRKLHLYPPSCGQPWVGTCPSQGKIENVWILQPTACFIPKDCYQLV